jgi:hypothetical protein
MIPNNFSKKEKFINTNDKDYKCDTPGFWKYEKKWDVIDNESKLLTPGIGTRHKTAIALNNDINPNNYNIPVSNTLTINKEKEKVYFTGYDTGPGHGFGNLNISNDIRVGDYTRKASKIQKAVNESDILDRWQYIDNRFQDSKNLVMEIPRGGTSTRKNNQLFNEIKDENIFGFRY